MKREGGDCTERKVVGQGERGDGGRMDGGHFGSGRCWGRLGGGMVATAGEEGRGVGGRRRKAKHGGSGRDRGL